MAQAGRLELDGSLGEGGGQVVRTALTLSMCTGRPFRMQAVRARRERPGLQRPHLACVAAAQAVCGAQATGADADSTELHFEPGPVRPGRYAFGAGSLGSCSLVLQTVWPALLTAAAPSEISLRGSTHNPDAPPFQFIQRAYGPLVQRLGAGSALRLRRHGFHPTGGGGIEATLTPAADGLHPFDLIERGPLRDAYAECLAAAIPHHVAGRELDTLGRALGWHGDQLRVPLVRQNEGPGNALMATLAHDGVTELFTACGAKGITAEAVARTVAREVRDFQASRAALGPRLADQWVLPLALAVWHRSKAARFTCSAVTSHARSTFAVIEQFLPVRIDAQPFDGGWTVAVSPSCAGPAEGL